MFGYTLISDEKLQDLKDELAFLSGENARLFAYHNERLTKPKRDKNGKLRNPNGTYAKEPR